MYNKQMYTKKVWTDGIAYYTSPFTKKQESDEKMAFLKHY